MCQGEARAPGLRPGRWLVSARTLCPAPGGLRHGAHLGGYAMQGSFNFVRRENPRGCLRLEPAEVLRSTRPDVSAPGHGDLNPCRRRRTRGAPHVAGDRCRCAGAPRWRSSAWWRCSARASRTRAACAAWATTWAPARQRTRGAPRTTLQHPQRRPKRPAQRGRRPPGHRCTSASRRAARAARSSPRCRPDAPSWYGTVMPSCPRRRSSPRHRDGLRTWACRSSSSPRRRSPDRAATSSTASS